MKLKFPSSIISLATGGVLAAGSLQSAEVPITSFDTEESLEGWSWEPWSIPTDYTFDALDAQGNGNSGSLRLVHNFTDAGPNNYQQGVVSFRLPAQVNAANDYSHINLDVKVDPTSTQRAAGDYGTFEVILRNGGGWEWNGLAAVPLADTEWHRLSLSVKSPADLVQALTFKLGQNGFAGPVTLNIDNITWTESTTPPPPPTLSIEPAETGLNIVASTGGQYDRQNIRTIGSNYSWIGATEPFSFSITIADYPGNSNPNFQTHLFIVPGFPGSSAAPDWNEPTVIFVQIGNNASGTAYAAFRWKIDEPNGNSQYWAGKPTVGSATVLGTWTFTFSNDNHLVMTSPDGTTTEADLPAELVAAFAGDTKLYVGIQPNEPKNIGLGAIFSNVKAGTPSNVLINDNFTGPALDEQVWEVNATSSSAVQLITPETAGYWIGWTLPDNGFVLQATTSLGSPSWTDVPTDGAFGATARRLHLPKEMLPQGDSVFFRMVKAE